MAQTYPILVGSAALAMLGITVEPRDYDVIADLDTAKRLSWNSTSKEGRLLTFTPNKGKKNVVDLTLNTDNPILQLIWDLMEKVEKPFLIEVELNDNLEEKWRIPPIEWLYALIRGHIHRIPAIFKTQSENIKIWKKYMNHYQLIRTKIGYQKLDQMMKTDENMIKIFNTQFNYINSKLGDAMSMDKSEIAFIDDNVKRYMLHDELHEHVAMINRGTKEVLFSKFKINPESVEMDQDLFLASTRDVQLNVIREELIVLYLERKLLPSVIELEENLKDFSSPDDFDEIVVNYVTNLCGTGHSWLRQWCLDHYQLFSDWKTYPQYEIKSFALTFHPNLTENETSRVSIDSLEDFLAYYENMDNNFTVIREHLDNVKKSKSSSSSSSSSEYTDDDEDEDSFLVGGYQIGYKELIGRWDEYNDNSFIIRNYECSIDVSQFGNSKFIASTLDAIKFPDIVSKTIVNYVNKDFKQLLSKQFNNPTDILIYDDEKTIIYNHKTGFCLCFDLDYENLDYENICFFIIKPYEDDGITFKISKFNINNNIFEATKDTYNLRERSTHYYCSHGGKVDRDVEYMNHYGSSFDELHTFIDLLARMCLNKPEDDKSDPGE